MILRALFVLAAITTAGSAAAQGVPEGGRRARPRDEVFRVIDEHVGRSLQERLGLTDEQTARALPVVRSLHAERRRFAERRIRAQQQMRRALRSGAITDARAAELVSELKAAEAEEAIAIRAGQDAVDAVLTPAQQVKYRIFEGEVEHRVRELMARVRAERRENGGRRRGDRPRLESPPPD